MSLANELTTIILLLLTFLLTPTITTTAMDSKNAMQQQQAMHRNALATLVQQPAIVLASAGTESYSLQPAAANVPSYAALHRNSQQYTPQQFQHSHQQQQSSNINMLDFRGAFVAPTASGEQQPELTTYPPPRFDFGMPRNITARSGQTAAINCRVEHLGDKSVSWIRKRDLHILTAGILTYTSDERFQVVRTADFKDWTLQVKYAQPRDSGIYECQVNTEPKISMAFRLNVIVTPPDAKAMIVGPSDLYVKVGSAITLTCHVKQPSSASDIGPIYWYRANYMLTPFVAHPNEAAIDMRRISMESNLGEKLQSRLRIANAQTADSGNYTCMPTTAEAASVMVNVINAETPAAMQKSAATQLQTRCCILLLLGTFSVRWLLQCSTSLSKLSLRCITAKEPIRTQPLPETTCRTPFVVNIEYQTILNREICYGSVS
ncbi:hemicentin-1 [Bactrocera dorsalis]|uniref:Hemicentin-1 n=1 Tax=Bactrocera dorsalis TaxID=27457 RepID=A0ABM3K778_BACDO|nr:hemicentin-1 [Bactrocera dorsalis]